MEYTLSAKTPLSSSIRQDQNKSYCPDAAEGASPDAAIKLLSIGRMYQQNPKLATVAITEGNDVLMLKDAGRKPVIASSAHNIHHVYFENRQVSSSMCLPYKGTAGVARNELFSCRLHAGQQLVSE
jgi:hypothetical protein